MKGSMIDRLSVRIDGPLHIKSLVEAPQPKMYGPPSHGGYGGLTHVQGGGQASSSVQQILEAAAQGMQKDRASFGGGGGRNQMSGNNRDGKPPIIDLLFPLKAMFDPRPPLEVPPEQARSEAEARKYSGIGQYVSLFESTPPPPHAPIETMDAIILKKRESKKQLNKEKNDLAATDYDPYGNTKATSNAYHTLFVGRMSYDTTEKKLRREFEGCGPMNAVKIVFDRDGKPRGYGFVEFEREDDMKSAYKKMDGKKIDGRRIVVDVERGRTVRNWRPTRLGAGLGGRKDKKSKKTVKEEAEKALVEEALRKQALISEGVAARKMSGGESRGGESRGGESGTYGPGGGNRDRDSRRSNSRDRNSHRSDRRPRSSSRDRERRHRSRSRDRGGYRK